MTIPEPSVPFEQVESGIASGKTYWTIRGRPADTSPVEVFHVFMSEEDGEAYPLVDYLRAHWSSTSVEGDVYELDEASDEFDLRGLMWHETTGVFEPDSTADYTVASLLGIELPD